MTVMNRWYAVRCCCNGEKLYGFLNLSEGPTRIEVVSETRQSLFKKTSDRRTIKLGYYGNELAIYSDNIDIEFWRGVKGFVEAKQ